MMIMTMKMQTHVAGHGAPLALVGGGLTGALSWEPFQMRLAATRRVARFQPLVVQYGLENRRVPADYSVDMESDALAESLAELHRGPVDVVAWSYGAAITLDCALDHPELIRTLTLIEPPAFWVLDAAGTNDDVARRESDELLALYRRLERADDVSAEDLASFVAAVGLVPPGRDVEQLATWPSWLEHRRSLRAGSAPWAHRDRVERLRAFDRPVLLVTGRGTSHMLRRITDGLAATLPDARVLELAGGHAPHIVEPEPFLVALARLHEVVS